MSTKTKAAGRAPAKKATAVNQPPKAKASNVAKAIPPRIIAGLVPGRLVNYVMKDGAIRPFLVVEAFDGRGLVNGILFFDGKNDAANHVHHLQVHDSGFLPSHSAWTPGVDFDATGALTPGTWHWPLKQPVVASGVDAEAIRTLIEAELPKLVSIQDVKTFVTEKLLEHTNTVQALLDSHSQMVTEAVSGKVTGTGSSQQAGATASGS